MAIARHSLWATFVAAVALTLGCQKQNAFVPPPPPQVTVAQPVQQEVVEYLEFTGTTEATASVDIRARVQGYLKQIAFQDGADVKQGDLLFVIEPAPLQAEKQAAEAALQKAKATLQLAEANLARVEALLPKRAVSQEEVDLRKAEQATAAAEVAAAQASLRQAELELSYTEIRAPISGRIGRHLVDVGALVQAEQTLLATIQSIDPIYAYFNVSESDLMRLRHSRSVGSTSSRSQPAVLQMAVGSDGDYEYQGVQDFQELGVDPETGTTLRRGVFANPGRALLPGLFVRVRTAVSDPTPKLLIEERALATDQRGDFVLVVNEKDIVEYRPVKVGTSVEGRRVVEGIEASDWVVVNGIQRARPGSAVTTQRGTETEVAASAKTPGSATLAQNKSTNSKAIE